MSQVDAGGPVLPRDVAAPSRYAARSQADTDAEPTLAVLFPKRRRGKPRAGSWPMPAVPARSHRKSRL